jgi:hypothetical protein
MRLESDISPRKQPGRAQKRHKLTAVKGELFKTQRCLDCLLCYIFSSGDTEVRRLAAKSPTANINCPELSRQGMFLHCKHLVAFDALFSEQDFTAQCAPLVRTSTRQYRVI